MSLIKQRDTILYAYSNRIIQNYYMSTYYALTNSNVFINFKNSINLNKDQDYYLQSYLVNFGDSTPNQSFEPNKNIYYKYLNEGSFYVSYSAVYVSENITITLPYITDKPFTIKNNWNFYDPNKIRLNDEILLNLPYSFNEIEIQPNEWGVEDIFNTSIYRLQECLNYLITKSQTINTYSPTLFFGWLGNNSGTKSSYLKWFTQSYNSIYLDNPEISKSSGITYFENVIDSIESNDNLYLIDNNKLRVFKNEANPVEINFNEGDNISSFLIEPVSIDVNETGDILYAVDKIGNVVYKININIKENFKGDINIQLFVNGFGGINDNNGFNTPTQVCYSNNNVYVLDYNNKCIKQYNQDLNWLFTYNVNDFDNDRPISIAALKNGLLYVVTEKYNVYIFDNNSNVIFEKFSVEKSNDGYPLIKISINESEDFIFILTEQFIYKYTLFGSYVNTLNINKTEEVKYNNIKKGPNGTLLISSNKCILKFHDILETFGLGEGLPYKYWSEDQLKVNKNEFVSDLIYNRSLIKMTQNIKNFRDTLNSRFIIATENVKDTVITYFSYLPIDLSAESPVFSDDIENEYLGVGVNELHLPSVINKELQKIYDGLLILVDFLSIKNYTVSNNDCIDSFCWSWDATSCYKLKLPLLKTCSINPISFQELSLNEENKINYAPNTTWNDATSKCCK
jgi:hypothetical protein